MMRQKDVFSNLQKLIKLNPSEILKNEVVKLYDLYKAKSKFINCVEYLDNCEYGLALECLIELNEETEQNFSVDFWNSIKIAASKMGMKKEVEYCEMQIARNKKDMNHEAIK